MEDFNIVNAILSAVILVIVFAVIFLAIRDFICWYFKINRQVKLQENILAELKQLNSPQIAQAEEPRQTQDIPEPTQAETDRSYNFARLRP